MIQIGERSKGRSFRKAMRLGLKRWLLFVVFLAVWMMVSSLGLILDPPLTETHLRQKWIGATFFFNSPVSLYVAFVRRLGWVRSVLTGPCVPKVTSWNPRRNRVGRIAIVTGMVQKSDQEIATYVPKCLERMITYSTKQGYSLLERSDVMIEEYSTMSPFLAPNWAKIAAVQSVGSSFEWILWLDRDIWIANLDFRLEDLIHSAPEETQIIIAKDDNGINSGVWIVRNSELGRALLKEWQEMQSRRFPFDQQALRTIFKSRNGEGFFVHRQCAMNSTPFISIDQETYMLGDFLIHLYAIESKRKDVCVESLSQSNWVGLDCL